MYCKKCGKEISDYSLKCSYCLEKVKPNYDFLVSQGILKDKNALETLYMANYKSAYFIAHTMTKNADDAMDILHDSYMKVFANLDSLTDPKKFESWFKTIVSNKCRDYLKRKNPSFLEDTYGEEYENELVDDRYDSDPMEYSIDEDVKQTIRKIIENLPDDQRLCVLMYYFDEMSIHNIAQQLGVSDNTIKSRLRLARDKIKAEIERLEDKGYKLRAVAIFPLIRNAMEITDIPGEMAGFDHLINELEHGQANPQHSFNNQATKTVTKAGVKTAVKTKVILGVIIGAIVIGGIATSLIIAKNKNKNVIPTAESKISSVTTQSTTTATTTTFTTTTKSTTTKPKPEKVKTWADDYKKLVKNFKDIEFDVGDNPATISYTLYDIDKNSIPELIFTANGSGDNFRMYNIKIYSWSQSKSSYNIGDLDTMGSVLELSASHTLGYVNYSGTARSHFYQLNIKNDKIIEKEIKEGYYIPDSEISKPLNQIYLYSLDSSQIANEPTSYIDEMYKKLGTETAEEVKNTVFPNTFIGMDKKYLIDNYFKGKYENDEIPAGQEMISAIKNTSIYPHYKFGFEYKSNKVNAIEVEQGGMLNDKIKIGMTYNELKKVCDFDKAFATFSIIGKCAIEININGEKWWIAFDLSKQQESEIQKKITSTDVAGVHMFDLTKWNPKSSAASYTDRLSIQVG